MSTVGDNRALYTVEYNSETNFDLLTAWLNPNYKPVNAPDTLVFYGNYWAWESSRPIIAIEYSYQCIN